MLKHILKMELYNIYTIKMTKRNKKQLKSLKNEMLEFDQNQRKYLIVIKMMIVINKILHNINSPQMIKSKKI